MPDPFANIQSRIRAFMRASVNGAGQGTDAEFEELALELFKLQREQNVAYRKLCEARAVGKVENWRDIPCAPTAAFKELEMTSLPCAERQRVFYSSGTTHRDRSKHYHSGVSIGLYEESLWSWFERNFRERIDGCRFFFLTPSAVHAPNSSLVHMFETIAANLPHRDFRFFGDIDSLGNWTLDLAKCVDALKSSEKPVAVFGTAFQFVHLLDELQGMNHSLPLPEKSWIFETGGYKGRSREVPKDELHRSLKERFSVSNVFSEYGMSELSSQAYDLGEGVFRFPPWARARIVSPATGRDIGEGERGLIRVYDLANVWSVMGIQTEDLAIKTNDGFSLAGRAELAEARGCSLMNV